MRVVESTYQHLPVLEPLHSAAGSEAAEGSTAQTAFPSTSSTGRAAGETLEPLDLCHSQFAVELPSVQHLSEYGKARALYTERP